MKAWTVCYDKFCLGNFNILCDDDGNVIDTDTLGQFENYLLGMWNDGLVVTTRYFDEEQGTMSFFLLLPDGSEQRMVYGENGIFVVEPYREAGKGRMAYLLGFNQGLTYKGFRGWDEYDAEEKMFLGVVEAGEEELTYCGRTVRETQADFGRVIDEYLKD